MISHSLGDIPFKVTSQASIPGAEEKGSQVWKVPFLWLGQEGSKHKAWEVNLSGLKQLQNQGSTVYTQGPSLEPLV